MKTNLFLKTLFLLFSLQLSQHLHAQQPPSQDLGSWIDQRFTKGLDSLHIVGATVVLVQGDSLLFKGAYGVENRETKTPITVDRSIFTIASISKTFVATAIMQLVEEGKIDLDTDVNTYLKDFQIDYPFGQPITIRHLLTHTAGFDERNLKVTVHTAAEMIPLKQHLQERMPPQIRAAGEAFDYSNYGYALLGVVVGEVSGVPFYEYVETNITKPLQMNSSGFRISDALKSQLVTSYSHKNGEFNAYDDYYSLKYPAGGFETTASDMEAYLKAYVNGGSTNGDQILTAASIEKMWNEIYRNFEGAENGWGLGFETFDWRGKQIVGHGGDILGFATDLRIIPEEKIGLYVAFNSSSIPGSVSKGFLQNFEAKLWNKLMPNAQKTTPEIPEMGNAALPLEEYAGTYRFTRYATTTLDKLAVFIGFAPEIDIEKVGDSLRIKQWNYHFRPVKDQLFFAHRDKGLMSFGTNHKNEIAYFHLDGLETYHKLAPSETISFQMIWIAVVLGICLVIILRYLWRRFTARKVNLLRSDHIQFWIAFMALLFMGVLGYSLMSTDPQEFFYGLPFILQAILVIPFLIIAALIYNMWVYVREDHVKYSFGGRIFHGLSFLIFFAFLFWLDHWNLIGFNY